MNFSVTSVSSCRNRFGLRSLLQYLSGSAFQFILTVVLFGFGLHTASAQDQTASSLSVNRTSADGSTLLNINGGASAIGYRLAAQNNGINVLRVAPTGNLILDVQSSVWGPALTVNQNGSAPAALFNGGYVGIGTTNPLELLQIGNGTVTNPAVKIMSDSGGLAQLKLFDNTTAEWTVANRGSDSEKLYIGTGDGVSSPKVVVDTSGNVGIGTTSPWTKLDITANASTRGPEIALTDTSGNANARNWVLGNASGPLPYGTIGFYNSSSPGGSPLSGTARMVIDNSGNVGIGTTLPSAKLDVAGNVNVQGNLAVGGAFTASNYTANSGTVTGGTSGLALNAGGTNQNVTISPSGTGATLVNGSVGLGTASPGYKLDIQDPTTAAVQIKNTTTNGNPARLVMNDAIGRNLTLYSPANVGGFDGAGSAGIGTTTNHPLDFATGNVTRMFIGTSGNVGIGTTSPDRPLTVNGTIHAAEVVVDTAVSASDLKLRPKAWADDVLASDHPLAPLSAVEQEIKSTGHLPGMPSANEVAANGVSVGDMQARLLAKIEELTLHQIEQEKHMSKLDTEVKQLRAENAALRAQSGSQHQ